MADKQSREVFEFIRKDEFRHNLMDVTDTQIETIIELYDEYRGKEPLSIGITADVSDALKGLKAVQKEARKTTAAIKELQNQKYLVIELDTLESVPRVLHQGEEIDHKENVEFKWQTQTGELGSGSTHVVVDYFDGFSSKGTPKRKSIREGIGFNK